MVVAFNDHGPEGGGQEPEVSRTCNKKSLSPPCLRGKENSH